MHTKNQANLTNLSYRDARGTGAENSIPLPLLRVSTACARGFVAGDERVFGLAASFPYSYDFLQPTLMPAKRKAVSPEDSTANLGFEATAA